MIKRIIGLALLLLVPTFCFASAKALLDRDQISLSESVNMEISADKESSQNPDLSVLNKDFDIGSTGKTVSVEMINGHIKQEARWVISLIPKRAGTLTIPSITIGSEKTTPVQLTVLNKPVAQHASEDFFIETSIEPKEAYEQQAVVYTIQVWASKPLTNVQVTQPSVSDGVILNPLDKQFNSIRKRGTREYEVVERHYLIAADKPGTLTIYPPSLRGLTFDQNPSRQFFMGADPQSVHVTGQELKLSIKPKPTAWQGTWWLPATNLSLKEEWSQDPHQWQAGTPITRTITIVGNGVSNTQIPDLKVDAPSGINIYPDKTEATNTLSNNTLTGTRQIKIAYVPTQEGQIHIPAIKLPWWNLNKNKMEIAELSALTLTISHEANNSPVTSKSIAGSENKIQPVPQPISGGYKRNVENSTWQWLAIILLILFMVSLVFIGILWRKLHLPKDFFTKNPASEEAKAKSTCEAINAIKKACAKNNPRATINATLDWARLEWPNSQINSLQDVACLVNQSEFTEQIAALLASCYSKEKTTWQAQQYWNVLSRYGFLSRESNSAPLQSLPPLQP